MVGVTLSRWTMAYFATALAFLLAAETLMAIGFGFPAADIASPQTLILVHIVAIGWLSLLMLGALFQFVPVLVARPLLHELLPLPALISIVTGLGALLLGFLQLADDAPVSWPFFPTAAGLLSLGFILALWSLGCTLWSARPLPLPARFVTVGLICAAATVALGTVFALTLGGTLITSPFVEITAYGIPIHAIAGLGGWLTLTAMGVSYRLLAMFMLGPEEASPRTHLVLYGATAALAAVIIGGTLAICANQSLSLLLAIAALLGFAALALYGADMLHLYRARKRRTIELNARMAAVALANLAAVAIISLVLIAAARFERHVAAVVFLLTFGWLTGLGLAKLYKITAFLTWLECYGPVLGKMPTPRVQDLVVESRAEHWFWLYFAAVWAATASLVVGTPLSFRLSAAAMLVATAAVVVQLARTRLLKNVSSELRRNDAGSFKSFFFPSHQNQ